MNKRETDNRTQTHEGQLQETPALHVEDHLKISDPENENIIVNTRG